MAKSEASDYIQPIYKERALKHLVKLAGGKRAANSLSIEQKKKMMLAIDEAKLPPPRPHISARTRNTE